MRRGSVGLGTPTIYEGDVCISSAERSPVLTAAGFSDPRQICRVAKSPPFLHHPRRTEVSRAVPQRADSGRMLPRRSARRLRRRRTLHRGTAKRDHEARHVGTGEAARPHPVAGLAGCTLRVAPQGRVLPRRRREAADELIHLLEREHDHVVRRPSEELGERFVSTHAGPDLSTGWLASCPLGSAVSIDVR